MKESMPEQTGREHALAVLKGETWTNCPACGSIAQAVGDKDDWHCGACGHQFVEVWLVPPQSDPPPTPAEGCSTGTPARPHPGPAASPLFGLFQFRISICPRFTPTLSIPPIPSHPYR